MKGLAAFDATTFINHDQLLVKYSHVTKKLRHVIGRYTEG